MADALMGPGPFTVFAPDDDAFVAVAKKLGTTRLGLLELPNLGDILKVRPRRLFPAAPPPPSPVPEVAARRPHHHS